MKSGILYYYNIHTSSIILAYCVTRHSPLPSLVKRKKSKHLWTWTHPTNVPMCLPKCSFQAASLKEGATIARIIYV